MSNKIKQLDLQESISVIFELIAFFIMFRHHSLSANHDFFTEQFLFVMPYLINFAFVIKKVHQLWDKLNRWLHISYDFNIFISVVIIFIILAGLINLMTIKEYMLFFGFNFEISLWILCPIEFLIMLNIIGFTYKIEKWNK